MAGAMFGPEGWQDLILGYAGQDATYLTSTTRWWVTKHWHMQACTSLKSS